MFLCEIVDCCCALVYHQCLQEVDDNDYQTEESASDETDSDIDLDENEEVTSDVEVEGEEKRKRRVITKAYKVPVNFAKYSIFVKYEVIMQHTYTASQAYLPVVCQI